MKYKNLLIAQGITLALMLGCSGGVYALPTLDTTDFITSPTNFNGFESIPNDGVHYTGGSGPYDEGGIRVKQVNGDAGNDIWVTINNFYPLEGNYGWYPDGGDNGYTEITRTDGLDFNALSLIFRPYFADVMYDLLDNGSSVLSGLLASPSFDPGRIGFVGGGFDTVRLRTGGASFYDGGFQALHIDSVKADVVSTSTVPEPASLSLIGIGLAGMAFRRRRKV